MPLPPRPRIFRDWPLRLKLSALFIAAILGGGIASLALGLRVQHRTVMGLAVSKVRHDLAAASAVYAERMNDIRDSLRAAAARESLPAVLARRDASALRRLLAAAIEPGRLESLTALDAGGRVIFRTSSPDRAGDDESGDPLVRRALRGEAAAGTVLVPPERLALDYPGLAARAAIPVLTTPRAADPAGRTVTEGLLLGTAVPVRDARGAVVGALSGGLLLSADPVIVDRIKEILFEGERFKGQDVGMVSLLIGDVRVATNVFDRSGRRAIGTRAAAEVSRAVLDQGRTWVGRAFVVDDWAIAAYEPLRDPDGRTIGMLCLGMLEKPFLEVRNRSMAAFSGLALGLAAALFVVVIGFVSRTISPLKRLAGAAGAIARGDWESRVELRRRDEIGELAQAFNRMAEDLREANGRLVQWGRTMEKRVEERTGELRDLQGQLVQSEKLAALGKLAAGVAHEINNPLTAILIYAHLLLEKAGAGHPFHRELGVIADEAERCAEIVRGLLGTARETPAIRVPADINELIDRAVQILAGLAAAHRVEVVLELDRSLPLLRLDRTKVLQVLWNLILNAFEAMPEGGRLAIWSAALDEGRSVEVGFADTGVGIPAKDCEGLFHPFFTTKDIGTGLGLAISKSLMEQHEGTIEVESEVGRGSVFRIKFRV